MAKKRSDIEVSADILKVAISGLKKSHIVYQTNLNHKVADKYLGLLKESSLITGPSGRRKIYSTTEKGLKYLQLLEGLQQYTNGAALTP